MNDIPKSPQEKLEDAIKEYQASRGHDDGLLVDWVLITAQHIPEADGESLTANAVYCPSHQPLYRMSGLLKYGEIRVAQRYNEPEA